LVGFENEYTRVETIRPSAVGCGPEPSRTCKQVVNVGENECVSVEVDELGVLGEGPKMEFGECDAEFWASEEGETLRVVGIEGRDMNEVRERGS
jgi:hypothetical protein